MKKFITVVLALAMAGAMSVTAFAANPIATPDGTDSCAVSGRYISEKIDTIKLDITWGDMQFVYHDSSQKWNTSTHVWDSTTPVWELDEGTSNKIELKNHSSCGLFVAFSFAPESTFPNINGDFKDKTQATLNYDTDDKWYTTNMAAANATDGASTFDAYFMPNTGALTSTDNKSAKIGTITITVDEDGAE